MNNYLLAISIGPVQEFIAAARRTRDLWFGSYLLSEISKSVAKSVKPRVTLIFPHPDTDLESNEDTVNVANVILAKVSSGDPKSIAADAKLAAIDCWKLYAEQARRCAGNAINPDYWEWQLGDVIEIYSAWVPHSDPYKYSEDRKKLMRLLAGRKSCRDFPEQTYKDVGVPKSSLDGQRPSVFVQPDSHCQRDKLRENWSKFLRLSNGEELDIVGVTKRLGRKIGEDCHDHPRYASVERVAAESWLQEKRNHPKFDQFTNACEAVPGLSRVGEQCYQYFPFEGTVIYKNRHFSLLEELGSEAESSLKEVARLLKELGGEPNPYLAVLVADGDRMGAAISDLKTLKENQQFSKDLAGFATEARKIVNAKDGVLVYVGGDDVLAFLPLDKCLCCARELRKSFVEILSGYNKNKEGQAPTLSVGIAIGHYMENLEDLLEYGRTAEKSAKKVVGKDALAVHLHKRGGSPIEVAASWKDDPDGRLIRFAGLIKNGTLPSKLPYELRSMASIYESWAVNPDAVIQQDLYRLIARKSSRDVDTVRQALSDELEDMNSAKLLTLAQELLIARQIATTLKQSVGEAK